MIANPTLPDGWSSEDLSSGQILILSPERLMVTVDFERRGFRSGLVQNGRLTSTKTYAGRGWMQRLVADAVAWLDGVRKR